MKNNSVVNSNAYNIIKIFTISLYTYAAVQLLKFYSCATPILPFAVFFMTLGSYLHRTLFYCLSNASLLFDGVSYFTFGDF